MPHVFFSFRDTDAEKLAPERSTEKPCDVFSNLETGDPKAHAFSWLKSRTVRSAYVNRDLGGTTHRHELSFLHDSLMGEYRRLWHRFNMNAWSHKVKNN